MEDFGLLVGRYSSSTPAISTDNELRELRVDAGGRVHSRATDDRDVSLRYFHDGETVDGVVANDTGILILGRNDTDSNYQALKVNDDGSLSVGFQVGTDISKHSDPTGVSDGEVALTHDVWVQVMEIAVASGTMRLDGYSFASDKNTLFQLVLLDGAVGDRTDLIEILDSQISTSSKPSDHVSFSRTLDRAGGAQVRVGIYAKQLQVGTGGVALAMINAHTTS